MPFQDNPKTRDCRVCGTTASLTGVEAGDAGGISRILLLYGIAFSAGGIPLLSLGDEVGQLNDPSYKDTPATAKDSRWVGRPYRPDALYDQRHDPATTAGAVFAGMKRLIAARRAAPALAGNDISGFTTGNPHVLGYIRRVVNAEVCVLANFEDTAQQITAAQFTGWPLQMTDLISGAALVPGTGLTLAPHQVLWLCDCGAGRTGAA